MTRSREAVELFERFLDLPGASQVYGSVSAHATDLAQEATPRRSMHPIIGPVVARAFAVLAYDHQKRSLPENNTLLNPRETLEFYSRRTGIPKTKTPDGMNRVLAGLSIPDGIELETGWVREIKRLHRYTSSSQLDHILRNLAPIRNVAIAQRNLRLSSDRDRRIAGRELADITHDEDRTPIRVSRYEVRYSAPWNSVLRDADLPEHTTVDYLPFDSLILGGMINILIEEAISADFTVEPRSKILPL